MEIKIGEHNSFYIQKTFKKPLFLCSCKKIVDGVILPCLHSPNCYSCLREKKIKQCPQCNENVDEKVRLIDIYRPVI